jgi:hypothetical protein
MPRQLTECGSVPCLKALVAGSDSLAMLPASAIDAEVSEGRIRPLPIGGPLLNRDIAVIFREQFPLTPASRELVEAIAAVGLAVGEGPDPLSDAGKASPPHPCEQVPARLVPPMPPRRARAGSHNAAL